MYKIQMHYEHEAYLISEGHIIKYLPLLKIGDEYGMKIRKNQAHFDYFNELFSTDSPIHFKVDYLLPGGMDIEELIKNNGGCLGGTLNLQFKDSTDYTDWVLYEVYIHTLKDKESKPEHILKTILRVEKIDSLLK